MKKITFLAFIMLTSLSFAQDGNLDTSFGTNGYVEFNNLSVGVYNDCLQPDNKIIYKQDNNIHRLNSNGSLDTSFGNSGNINMIDPGNYDYGIVYSNTDDKIVAFSKNLYSTYYMSKYNLDGTYDATFGNGQGYINLDVDDIESQLIVKTSPDGSIFIGGNDDRSGTGVDDLFLRKYNFDGTPDTSFHYTASSIGINLGSSSVGHSSDDRVVDVDILSDTKIVLTGRGTYYHVNSVSHYRSSIVIIENGITNPTKRSAPYSNPSHVVKTNTAIGGANNDIYMLTGINNTFTVNPINIIHKWSSTGSSINFGTDDRLTISLEVNPNEFANFQRILVQPDGKIILAGTTFNENLTSFKKPNLIIARYLADGTIDTTFGTNGYILHDITYSGASTDNVNHALTNLFASDDYSEIYMSGRNSENYIILKFSNPSLLSIEDYQITTAPIQLYPNPAEDIINLKVMENTNLNQKHYSIINIKGEIVKKGVINGNSELSNINVSQLSSGIYFMKIKGFSEVLKLIKK